MPTLPHSPASHLHEFLSVSASYLRGAASQLAQDSDCTQPRSHDRRVPSRECEPRDDTGVYGS